MAVAMKTVQEKANMKKISTEFVTNGINDGSSYGYGFDYGSGLKDGSGRG